jgi:hypothetical protein
MKLALRPATPLDIPAFTDIYSSAFSSGDPSVYNFWYGSIIDEMKDANNHFLCIVNEDAQGPESSSRAILHIIAYVKWVSPASPITTDLPTWPVGGDAALADYFFGNMAWRQREHYAGVEALVP